MNIRKSTIYGPANKKIFNNNDCSKKYMLALIAGQSSFNCYSGAEVSGIAIDFLYLQIIYLCKLVVIMPAPPPGDHKFVFLLKF